MIVVDGEMVEDGGEIHSEHVHLLVSESRVSLTLMKNGANRMNKRGGDGGSRRSRWR
jgi:hypothetical protein